MLKYGNWLTEVTSVEGREFFEQQYDMSPARFMVNYDLKLTKKIADGDPIKNIMFLEYDGSVNQLFQMQAGDRVYVYADQALMDLGCFNSEQGAFMDVFTADGRVFVYFVPSGPYCLESKEDDEWWELHDDGYDGVVAEIQSRFQKLGPVTFENTIFVRQL